MSSIPRLVWLQYSLLSLSGVPYKFDYRIVTSPNSRELPDLVRRVAQLLDMYKNYEHCVDLLDTYRSSSELSSLDKVGECRFLHSLLHRRLTWGHEALVGCHFLHPCCFISFTLTSDKSAFHELYKPFSHKTVPWNGVYWCPTLPMSPPRSWPIVQYRRWL